MTLADPILSRRVTVRSFRLRSRTGERRVSDRGLEYRALVRRQARHLAGTKAVR